MSSENLNLTKVLLLGIGLLLVGITITLGTFFNALTVQMTLFHLTLITFSVVMSGFGYALLHLYYQKHSPKVSGDDNGALA